MSARRVVIAAAMLLVVTLSSVADPLGIHVVQDSGPVLTAGAIRDHEVEWTFSEDVRYGRYLTGDYWVLGPVEIVEISPGYDGQNGTMINPIAGSSQGFDSYGPGFDSSKVVRAPVVVQPGSSVVTAVSDAPGSRPALSSASVLTVVGTVPPDGSFRPPIIGDDKTARWTWNDVEDNMALLPNLPPTASTPSDVSYYIEYTSRPWILNGRDYQGRYFHPPENMPGSYHREIGRFLQDVSALLLMDIPDKDVLLRHFVQVGIDYYGMAVSGRGTSAYWAWPVIFAGLMLDDEDIRDVYTDGRDRHIAAGAGPREYFMIYDVATERLSSVTSSIVPAGQTWTGDTVAWRQDTNNSDCYEQEHLHPDEWPSVSSANGCSQPLSTRETYRRINSPAWVGQALAAHLMDARDYHLRSDLYFAYVERWMRENPSYLRNLGYDTSDDTYGSSLTDFIDELWAQYHY